MSLDSTKVEALLQRLRKHYPNWSSFLDPAFLKDEIDYKRETVAQAKEMLAKSTLSSLIAKGDFDEFVQRVEKIGKANNLLWRQVPRKGDLSILYQPNLNKERFCASVFDLIHAEGPAEERFRRYLEFVNSEDLPNRWTFPTYFLFISNPETEIFVKPKSMKWFLQFIGDPEPFSFEPDAVTYSKIKSHALELKSALAQYGAHDMIDVQGFIWACAPTKDDNRAEPRTDLVSEPEEDYAESRRIFSARTFNLLAGLNKTPTKEFYIEHREEFASDLEEPFQRLFKLVVDRLPKEITARLETENRLFSRILKNDWGRGGAWDHYWGALYPKGGKRIETAQLYVRINPVDLSFGFGFGTYGSSEKERFIKNCRVHEKVLRDNLGHLKVTGIVPWSEPSGENIEPEILSETRLKKDEVLRLSGEDLADRIARSFEELFPLILLSISDDPLAEIERYPEAEVHINPPYTLESCASDTGFATELLRRWVTALERKGQAIIYGPPGTGKTFLAEHLARHLIAEGDGFQELVQFHPTFAYEDFIEGIRPQSDGNGQVRYPIVSGRFLQFCDKAKLRNGRCVLIIDEINRANLSRVFGELMYLLEYRDQEIVLSAGSRFRIPSNVRLIGTMNTADRSIALVDHALRRRFAFMALYPDYDVLRKYHRTTGFPVEQLIAILQRLNKSIGDQHYEVGISFFMRQDLALHLKDIWTVEIEPYLEEYFFDQRDKVDDFRWSKISYLVEPEHGESKQD